MRRRTLLLAFVGLGLTACASPENKQIYSGPAKLTAQERSTLVAHVLDEMGGTILGTDYVLRLQSASVEISETTYENPEADHWMLVFTDASTHERLGWFSVNKKTNAIGLVSEDLSMVSPSPAPPALPR